MTIIFFWKYSKFDVRLKNAQKNSEKLFSFWDKSIWIVWIKLSVLRRQYLSSAVNVLAKSVKIFHVTKSKFFQLNYLQIINEYGKGAAFEIKSEFRSIYHVASRGVFSNGTF